MAKLSLIQRVITPTAKRAGAKKNLLRQDGIASDVAHEDDDSSSLSDRQEKGRSRSKKKFSALKFLRRIGTRGHEEEDGYESDVSTGSTRSTSSSFLRYQNRAIWKSKLTKKSVLERRGDGSEAPVEDEARAWPMFDKIYKRQNQVRKMGEPGEDEGEDGDDEDGLSNASSGDSAGGCRLAPPAPAFSTDGLDEELLDQEAVREIERSDRSGKASGGKPQEQAVAGVLVSASEERGSGEGDVENTEQVNLASSLSSKSEIGPDEGSWGAQTQLEALKNDAGDNDESLQSTIKSNSSSLSVDSSPVTAQESGIPTSEAPKQNSVSSPVTSPHLSGIQSSLGDGPKQDVPRTPKAFPTQKLNHFSPANSVSPKEKKERVMPANLFPNESKSKITDLPSPTNISPKGKRLKPTTPGKPPRPSRQKKTSLDGQKKASSLDGEKKDILPRSIPHTICYSLRSAIGDGSARQRNSHSLMERRPLRPNGCSVDTSYWSHRGKRNYMEDRFAIEHMGSTGKNKDEPKQKITLLAVFDGHGGSAASQFCSDWLSSYVRKNNEHFPDNLPEAMKTAFMKMDLDFVISGAFDGTTACACALVGKKLVCCNVGDSRAIIIKRDGTYLSLSEDHKPDRNDETKRINDLGGRVIHWGRWRVEGVLAVSRSIGDAKLKPYVTAEPDVKEHEIGEDDMFLVVASDGVWDTMSSDLVAKFVLVNTCKIVDKSLKVDDKLLCWIARQVAKRARENGSSDNISCIVANLTGKSD